MASSLSPAAIDRSLAELVPLVEASQSAQEEIRAFRERYLEVGRDAPLPPKSLRGMAGGRRRYLGLQARLVEIAERFEHAPEDEQADPLLRDQALGIALVAALTIYDNYLSMLTILRDDRFRRLLTTPGYGYAMPEDELWRHVGALNSDEARRRLRRLVEAWQAGADDRIADDRLRRIEQAVSSSVAWKYAASETLGRHLPSEWQLRRTRFQDALSHIGEEAIGAISEAFGNGIGLVELRDGKLRGNARIEAQLSGLLQPLDLLLEKTPFRLTDVFIPGHFGHVAIWMGTDAELDALGVWNDKAMRGQALEGCRAQIQEGRSVLEALRSGVALNTLAHFLNVDDLAVLRPTRLDAQQRVSSLVRGFEQVGKEYDFNFDVETIGSIVCSELPYHVYPGVEWTTGSQLGRFTISPDQVADQALSDAGAFELVLFIHDGVRLEDSVALERMRSLMSGGD